MIRKSISENGISVPNKKRKLEDKKNIIESLTNDKKDGNYKDDDKEGTEKRNIPGSILRPKYTIKVDGIGLVNDVLIDSGRTVCLIREDVLKDSIGLIDKIKKTTTFATLIDGSIMNFLGSVDLCVTYLDQKVEMPFLVSSKESNSRMILGANWIMKSRAILQSDGTELRVSFGGGKRKKFLIGYKPKPLVSVKVDGIDGLVKDALVDTGATGSSIRRDLLTKELESAIIPTDHTTTKADGKKIKVEGYVSLNITHDKITTCIENVRVKSNMLNPLNLGMDWIHKTRVVIQSDGSKLTASQPDLQLKV